MAILDLLIGERVILGDSEKKINYLYYFITANALCPFGRFSRRDTKRRRELFNCKLR